MSPDKVMEYLLYLEAKHEVGTWRCQGLDVWPIIRQSLYNQLIKKKVTSKKKSVHQQSVRSLYTAYQAAKKRLRQVKNIDVLFLANQTHRARLHGQVWNRFCDPLMDELALLGKSSFLIEESKTDVFSEKNHQENRLFNIEPLLNWQRFSRQVEKRLRLVRPLNLEFRKNLESIVDELQSKSGSVISINKIIREIESVILSLKLAGRVLDALAPKKIHTVCYYGAWNMAVLFEARKRGIITSDIQHGVINDLHPMYCNWSNMPTSGFNTLPQVFFTWSATELNFIMEWATKTNFHRSATLGNPWLSLFREKKVSTQEIKIDKPLILYTLANRDDIFFNSLVEFVNKYHHKFEIWFRMHPRQIPFADEVEAELKDKMILDKINLKQASELPLPFILSKTSAHITLLSSVVLEAMEFNVPSLVLGDLGYNYFKQYENSQAVQFAKSEMLEPALLNLMNKRIDITHEFLEISEMAKMVE